jgi:hypothetical protein
LGENILKIATSVAGLVVYQIVNERQLWALPDEGRDVRVPAHQLLALVGKVIEFSLEKSLGISVAFLTSQKYQNFMHTDQICDCLPLAFGRNLTICTET